MRLQVVNVLLVCILFFDLSCTHRPTEDKNVNVVSETGTTPLMTAAFHGEPDALELLLKNGADPKILDQSGQSALHYAAISKTGETCAPLVAAQISPNQPDQQQLTAFMLAARFGKKNCLEAMKLAGADENYSESTGWTALTFVIPRNNLELFLLLVDNDTNLQHLHEEGWSYMHIAALYRADKIYEWLKKNTKLHLVKDEKGKTPAQLRKEIDKPATKK